MFDITEPSLRGNYYNTWDSQPSNADKDCIHKSSDIQLTLQIVYWIFKYVSLLNIKSPTCY